MPPICTLQIISRIDNQTTEYDGQYVVKYDPSWSDGPLPQLITTAEIGEARKFDDPRAASEYWMQIRGPRLRPDGKPDRPLTAFNVVITPLPEGPVCDFCEATSPKWTYPAEDIAALGVPEDLSIPPDVVNIWSSDGAWAACDDCSELIEQGAWDQLADRVFPLLDLIHPEHDHGPEYQGTVRALWAMFDAVRRPRELAEVASVR